MFSMPSEVALKVGILGSFATRADVWEKIAKKGPFSYTNISSNYGLK